jgi:hypothetical protein
MLDYDSDTVRFIRGDEEKGIVIDLCYSLLSYGAIIDELLLV